MQDVVRNFHPKIVASELAARLAYIERKLEQ